MADLRNGGPKSILATRESTELNVNQIKSNLFVTQCTFQVRETARYVNGTPRQEEPYTEMKLLR